MSAAKKIDQTVEVNTSSETTEVPAWKKKKQDRQKLLRAIRAKSYADTIRSVIRKELKNGDFSED